MSDLDKITKQRDDYLKRGHELKRELEEAKSYIVDIKKKLEVANTGYPYHSEKLDEVFTAFSKAQGDFPAIARNKKLKHRNSKYASLGGVLEAIIPSLAKNGLHITFIITRTNVLHTRIGHSSGQFFESHYTIPFPTEKEFLENNRGGIYMQGLGTIRTYCRRYESYGILGISPDTDTDGEYEVYDIKHK